MNSQINLTWIKPKKWSDLPLYKIEKGLFVNEYYVEIGFITDGGTIPWGLRDIFNPMGKGLPAFIAHDHKCKRDDYDRKQADKELYRDLKDCGVNVRRAWLMYRAVRMNSILTGKG